MILPPELTKYLNAYARQRTEELLLEHAFHHQEITAIINNELTGIVNQAVTDCITPLLATKRISLDANMRVSLKS